MINSDANKIKNLCEAYGVESVVWGNTQCSVSVFRDHMVNLLSHLEEEEAYKEFLNMLKKETGLRLHYFMKNDNVLYIDAIYA